MTDTGPDLPPADPSATGAEDAALVDDYRQAVAVTAHAVGRGTFPNSHIAACEEVEEEQRTALLARIIRLRVALQAAHRALAEVTAERDRAREQAVQMGNDILTLQQQMALAAQFALRLVDSALAAGQAPSGPRHGAGKEGD